MTSQIKTVLLLALLSAIIIGLGGIMGGRTGIIIAFVIFLLIKGMNRLHRKKEDEPAVEQPAAPTSEELLTEIRDLLKERNT